MFPVNLFIGGAIGSVVTYVYKDEEAKKWVTKTGQNLKEGTQYFIASFKKKSEEGQVVGSVKTGEIVEASETVKTANT